jgi:cation:H+ antiporter
MTVVLIVLGLAILAIGAESLVRGAASLALRMGITPLVVGLTIVAIGTSSPELAVSIQAALEGNSDISIGNVVGSNIANIGLILAIAALIRPIDIHPQALKRDVPMMIAITLVLVLMLVDGEVGRLDGVLLVIGSIAYTVFAYWEAHREKKEIADEVPPETRATWLDLVFIVVGLGMLILGARMLVENVIIIAEWLNINRVIIALTVIAVGTSLPELAITIATAYKNHGDLLVGNILGSNSMNILLILGITAVLQPIQTSALRTFDIAAMVAFSIVILPLMLRGRRISRTEGALLLAGYAGYTFSLIPN